jgi:hypothetical protein
MGTGGQVVGGGINLPPRNVKETITLRIVKT